MSFKDWMLKQALEAELIEWEHKQAIAKADAKRAAKHIKRLEKAKKTKPPMYRPDPVFYRYRVVLNVRPTTGPQKGELIEFEDVVPTMSELEAINIVKKKAQAIGLIYRGVVDAERV